MKRTAEDKFADALIILAVLIIIALKITGIIKISWLWLLSPLWISAAFGAVLAVGVTIFCIIINLIKKIKRRKKENERY